MAARAFQLPRRALQPIAHQPRKLIPLTAASAVAASSAAYLFNVRAFAAASPASSASAASAAAPAPAPPALPAPVDVGAGIQSFVLYQYDSCPFCNKVKAVLDYCKVPYEVVEVNPLTKSELKFSDYKKVPLAIINGVPVKESGVIIATLQGALRKVRSPETRLLEGADPSSEAAWCHWLDTVFVHSLTPNLYDTWALSLESFDYLTERNFPAWSALGAKYVGAGVMYMVSKKIKKKNGWSDVEKVMVETSERLTKKLQAKGSHFLGGSKPDLADVAVFGVIRSIQKLTAYRNLMAGNPRLLQWYQAVAAEVGPSLLTRRGE